MKSIHSKKRVLFICTHNAARSQMAEGFLRDHYGDQYEAYSAGTEPTHVDPCAIKAMHEVEIDISTYRSKGLDEFEGKQFDFVVALCAEAQESCPIFVGGAIYIHRAFDDPAHSDLINTKADKCAQFREVRDQIERWVDATFSSGV